MSLNWLENVKKWYFLVKKIFLTFVTSNCRKAVPWHFHLNGKIILSAKLKFNKVKKIMKSFLYKEQLTQILFPPLPKCKTNNEKKSKKKTLSFARTKKISFSMQTFYVLSYKTRQLLRSFSGHFESLSSDWLTGNTHTDKCEHFYFLSFHKFVFPSHTWWCIHSVP